jgi:hypothetical protein
MAKKGTVKGAYSNDLDYVRYIPQPKSNNGMIPNSNDDTRSYADNVEQNSDMAAVIKNRK